jgi:hypothetical protein
MGCTAWANRAGPELPGVVAQALVRVERLNTLQIDQCDVSHFSRPGQFYVAFASS